MKLVPASIFLSALIACPTLFAQSHSLGIFHDHNDVGTVLHPGSAAYDAATGAYTLTGSGENMWFGIDDFQYAWKKVAGDVAISADIAFASDSGNPHRKAVLMIRQSLDGNSPAVDIAQHGVGLTSLQFRLAPGDDDREVQSNVTAPIRIRLEKRGDYFYAFVAGKDGKLQPAGASIKLPLHGDFYIGIGVCAHDKDATATATFRNVKLEQLAATTAKPQLWSSLETVPIASADRRVAFVARAHFEAPNWSRDGAYFLFNQDGRIEQLFQGSTRPWPIDTGTQVHCNNDHGISPDGTRIAVSDSTSGTSLVYTLPNGGGTPTRITPTGPSYWHGWSPDNKTLAFVGQRTVDGKQDFDIYTISVAGGKEERLTTAPGLDDGPDYSPDGQWIYFNSERTGHMQIWRMHPDGSDQQQVVTSQTNDWFPHISPDGKWMVYVRYAPGITGHPADKDVQIMLMSLADKKTSVLVARQLHHRLRQLRVPHRRTTRLITHLLQCKYDRVPQVPAVGTWDSRITVPSGPHVRQLRRHASRVPRVSILRPGIPPHSTKQLPPAERTRRSMIPLTSASKTIPLKRDLSPCHRTLLFLPTMWAAAT